MTGTTSFAAGFGVSLYDPHEIEHDLYLSSTSTQTYGEYGFAYTVTIHFPSTGATLTTVPLVDVYALSDPNLGDFPDNAGYLQQDAASVAIFQAATRSEPPSWATATSGSWTSPSNWANWPGNGIVNSPLFGAGVQVAIDAATTRPLTIALDNPQTIGADPRKFREQYGGLHDIFGHCRYADVEQPDRRGPDLRHRGEQCHQRKYNPCR